MSRFASGPGSHLLLASLYFRILSKIKRILLFVRSIKLDGGGCMFGIFKESEKIIDTYEHVSFILKSLLTYELRDLPIRYEFWYRVAIRQEELRSLNTEHRRKITMTTAVGRFHQTQYEVTKQKLAKLERLADIYKSFCIEEERDALNHRLHFHKEAITELYEHVQNKELYTYCDSVQQQFWDAVSEDILNAIAHLD